MINSKRALINIIKLFMDRNGGHYDSFYVGLANDPLKHIFYSHHVDAKRDFWACYPTLSPSMNHEVLIYFTEQLKTDGVFDNFKNNSKFIYVYQKTPETDP